MENNGKEKIKYSILKFLRNFSESCKYSWANAAKFLNFADHTKLILPENTIFSDNIFLYLN
jgi:hypothetical protein